MFAAKAQYFLSSVKASGTNFQIYIKPNPGGGDITTDFSLIEFFVRVPTSVTGLTFGAPVSNTVDFPQLNISQAGGENPQGGEAGYRNFWFIYSYSVPLPAARIYTDGVEYLVCTIPVLVSGVPTDPGTISGFQIINNTNFVPHYLTITNGGGGELTARSVDPNLQVFYASTGGSVGICTNSCSAGPGSTNMFAVITSGTLPVVFDKYEIDCNDKGALLVWSTVSEHNSSHFEVQRSVNGVDWVTIDNVTAAGTSDIPRKYQYLDISAPGYAFYRLKQVDIDGRYIYTAIRRTNCKSKSFDAVIYPIPAKDNLTLVMKSEVNVSAEFQVIDVNGKMVQKIQKTVTQGNNNIIFNVSMLPAGQYILKSSRPELAINKKFVIAR